MAVTERYPAQPEILRYLQHVADRIDLPRTSASTPEAPPSRRRAGRRVDSTEGGERPRRRSSSSRPSGACPRPIFRDFRADDFEGSAYTPAGGRTEPVDFAGKRVGIIGTGSSGIQAIPVIAEQAAQLTVFQRTAQFVPAPNGPLDRSWADVEGQLPGLHRRAGTPGPGCPYVRKTNVARERRGRRRPTTRRLGPGGFRSCRVVRRIAHRRGGQRRPLISSAPRSRDRHGPRIADDAEAADYPFGAKRVPLDTDYYETFNRPNVRLVDDADRSSGSRRPDQDLRRPPRPGRDRVRHRVRRANRTASVPWTSRAATAGSWRRRMAQGPGDLPWADRPGVPEPSDDCRAGQPIGAVQRAGGDRTERRVDRRLQRDGCAGRGADIDGGDRADGRRLDHARAGGREPDAPTRRPLPGTWGPTFPANPDCFFPIWGASDVYRQKCDEIAVPGTRGSSGSDTTGPTTPQRHWTEGGSMAFDEATAAPLSGGPRAVESPLHR